ncbi:hypothetical protein HID58_031850 [Brassica napus]|uniref:RIN4 pathogenic type III effector avirulence factor Avr cleavage site domain-containing protein n=3 Tax=Brassica TaxID=3705 RepID=A0ABQ8BUM9_BRANA|nr:RPM1-interacting protein 4 [Brassica napus]KAH0908529.1 hypothetical protein HID58_031850 [Brassica napus]CAG7859980.1 unnamed protein product [Brassica rapa]VDC58483.1 unnamed protein product [Brassica rapa]
MQSKLSQRRNSRCFTQSQEIQVNFYVSSTPSCRHVSLYLCISLFLKIIFVSEPLKEFVFFWQLEINNMAANRPHVPKFGDWKEDVPFTVVFDKASRTKQNANMSNPNEYPNMNPSPAQTPNHRYDQPPNHNARPRHERFSSREETEFRSSPVHNERNNRVRAPPPAETYNHQAYGGGGRSHGNPPETNRRQQHEPPRVQPIPNLRGRNSERVAIPPFPGSGSENQSYTLIFDKVKEDRRQSGNVRSYNGSSHTTPTRPLNDQRHQPLPSSPKSCCFPPWGRK